MITVFLKCNSWIYVRSHRQWKSFLAHAHTHTYRKVELVEIVLNLLYLVPFICIRTKYDSILLNTDLCYNIVLLKLTVEKRLFFLFFKNIQSIVDQFYILLIVKYSKWIARKMVFLERPKNPPIFKNYLLQ